MVNSPNLTSLDFIANLLLKFVTHSFPDFRNASRRLEVLIRFQDGRQGFPFMYVNCGIAIIKKIERRLDCEMA